MLGTSHPTAQGHARLRVGLPEEGQPPRLIRRCRLPWQGCTARRGGGVTSAIEELTGVLHREALALVGLGWGSRRGMQGWPGHGVASVWPELRHDAEVGPAWRLALPGSELRAADATFPSAPDVRGGRRTGEGWIGDGPGVLAACRGWFAWLAGLVGRQPRRLAPWRGWGGLDAGRLGPAAGASLPCRGARAGAARARRPVGAGLMPGEAVRGWVAGAGWCAGVVGCLGPSGDEVEGSPEQERAPDEDGCDYCAVEQKASHWASPVLAAGERGSGRNLAGSWRRLQELLRPPRLRIAGYMVG